jgi:hypothetical protein
VDHRHAAGVDPVGVDRPPHSGQRERSLEIGDRRLRAGRLRRPVRNQRRLGNRTRLPEHGSQMTHL